MKNLFKSNWFLFGISLFAAILIWVFIVYQLNPMYETTIRNVPLSFVKYSDDFNNGKLALLSKSTETVNINVRGNRSTLAKLTRDKVYCSVNMSDVTSAGTHKLPINVTVEVSGVDLVSKDPYNVSVVVDEVITKELDITVETKGSPASGYIYDSLEYATDKIRLTGAKSILSTVKTAKISIDITGKTQSQSGRYKIILLDKNGKTVENEGISRNISYVELKCNILMLKAVKVKPVLSADKTASGKKVSVAEVNPQTFNLLGSKNVLSSVEELETKEINVRYAKDGDKVTVELLPLDDGIKFEEEKKTAQEQIKESASETKKKELPRTAEITLRVE